MAEPSLKEKRRGLDFANEVAELAAKAPDGFSKKRVYQAVGDLRRHYGFSEADKRRHITIYLRAGCSNYDDLQRETGLPKPTITEIVQGMKDAGEVDVTQLNDGTRGRPGVHIRLTA